MDARTISLALILTLAAAGGPSAWAGAKLDANGALRIAQQAFRRHRVSSLRSACLIWSVERETDAAFAIGVRERHGGKCGGDPTTSPSVAHLELRKRDRTVWMMDPVSGEDRRLR
jgi:hypothetical protein